MRKVKNICERPAPVNKDVSPTVPPWPGPVTNSLHKGSSNDGSPQKGYSCVSTATRDLWDRLFDEGYKADVSVNTDDGGIIYAHANILGMASPVIKAQLKQSHRFRRQRSISIRGVPVDAVRVFIRFLYSSCYEMKEMEAFVVHLLVLAHVYVVPHLKQECEKKLEHGWKTMKKSHPTLEKELVELMIEEDTRQKERIKKINERKIYMLLYEAMEALVHIYEDGCRTIGPSDKDFKENQAPCKYVACKGLELLVRHFAGCKLRVPGGCIHCRRMWQLLELHSRLCSGSHNCRVPLCRNFKERIKKQSKKDEIRWKMLVKKILTTKRIAGAPFVSSAFVSTFWQ